MISHGLLKHCLNLRTHAVASSFGCAHVLKPSRVLMIRKKVKKLLSLDHLYADDHFGG